MQANVFLLFLYLLHYLLASKNITFKKKKIKKAPSKGTVEFCFLFYSKIFGLLFTSPSSCSKSDWYHYQPRFIFLLLLHWFGLVWFGLVWFGLVWFGLVWFGLVWFGLVWIFNFMIARQTLCVYRHRTLHSQHHNLPPLLSSSILAQWNPRFLPICLRPRPPPSMP